MCASVFPSLALLPCAQWFSQFGTAAMCARVFPVWHCCCVHKGFSSLTVAQCSGFSNKCTQHTQHLS